MSEEIAQANDQTVGVYFDRGATERMPAAVIDYVRRSLANQSDELADLRSFTRRSLSRPILVMPVDDDFQSTGRPFEAFGRDLSAGGVGILYTRSLNAKHLAIEVTMPNGRSLSMIGEVTRCVSVGRFYDIGLKFIAKASSLKTAPVRENKEACTEAET